MARSVIADSNAYVASFVGHEAGKALFTGAYSIKWSKPITVEEYWQVPAILELKNYGLKGLGEEEGRASCLWFDLILTDKVAQWNGKLIVNWPPPEPCW